MEAQEWADFVKDVGTDVNQAFGNGMLLLDKMKASTGTVEEWRERLEVLELPLPLCFKGSPLLGLFEKSINDTKQGLLFACSMVPPEEPVIPDEDDDVANPEEPAAESVEPSPQQLVNALDAMCASKEDCFDDCLEALSSRNTFTHLTLSGSESPLKFVICEVEHENESEFYVAFSGAECWEDVPNGFFSEPTIAGRYHHNFFERISTFPLAGLAEKVLQGARLFFVGHNFGGAIATVATIEIMGRFPVLPHERLICITAGAPFAGDSGLHSRCEQLGITENLFHLLHPDDALPGLLSFVGAIKNGENGCEATLKETVQHIARLCCQTTGKGPVADEIEHDLPLAVITRLFRGLVFCLFEPVGKYWLFSREIGEQQPTWGSMSVTEPTSFEELQAGLQDISKNELSFYRERVITFLGEDLPSCCNDVAITSGASHWIATVEQCHMSVSNGRLACDIIGAGLSFVCSISVAKNRFQLAPRSVVSSRKLSVEKDSTEGIQAADAMVTAVSILADCSFAGVLPIVVSEMALQAHGDFVAKLSVSEVLERSFRLVLFSPTGSERSLHSGPDPIDVVEALVGCQPLETLYRFLAGQEPLAAPATFNILGRLPEGVEEMVNLGVSRSSVESLREALRNRLNQMDMRRIASEAGTLTRAAGAGAVAVKAVSLASQLQKNAASLALAASELAAARQAAAVASTASATVAVAAKTGAGGARVAAKVGQATGKIATATSKLSAAVSQVQNLSAAQAALGSSAQFLGFAASYGMFAITAATTAWETYSLFSASKTVKKGSSFADIHEALMDDDIKAIGDSTWKEFDEDMVRGINAADLLASIVGKKTKAFPPITAKKILADLFPNTGGLVFSVKETLLRQRKELHERQQILRAVASKTSTQESDKIHREVEQDCARMLDIHCFWTDFVLAALSGRTDVALSRRLIASVLWVSKLLLLDNVLQPWVPIAKLLVCGKAASQEAAQKQREAVSYVIDPSTFEVRVDLLYNGIVGASDEHVFEGKELYSKLFAIRKHAPPGVTWLSSPLAISSSWEAVMANPGIETDSALASVTKDSRFEVACWLVSCLCVAELYDACMSTSVVALMGVTSTGKSSLTRAIAMNPEEVVAGGSSRHRTSVPLMHLCKPFEEGHKPFSVFDMAGHTDQENKLDPEGSEDVDKKEEEEDTYLPGETYLPMTALCSSLAILVPFQFAYVKPFREKLLWLSQNGRTLKSGTVMAFITKCEDIIAEALEMEDEALAAALVRKELQAKVRRIGVPSVMSMANTHFAVILNPMKYRSEDLRRLGIWEAKDIHQWMSGRCNPEQLSPSIVSADTEQGPDEAVSTQDNEGGPVAHSSAQKSLSLCEAAQQAVEKYIARRCEQTPSVNWALEENNFILSLEASEQLWQQGLDFYVRKVCWIGEPPVSTPFVEPLGWLSAVRDTTVASFSEWIQANKDLSAPKKEQLLLQLSCCDSDELLIHAPGLACLPDFGSLVAMFSSFRAVEEEQVIGMASPSLPVARGSGGEINSDVGDVSCENSQAPTNQPDVTYVLCVGIQRSVDTLPELFGPYNDLELVESVLNRRMTQDKLHLVTLSDVERNVTAADIRRAFNAAVRFFDTRGGVVRDGQLLIHFSGHAWPDCNNNFTRFLPSNLDPACAHEFEDGGLGTEELFRVRENLQMVRQNHSPIPMAVFFDCCYSGAILESKAAANQYITSHRACISFVCSSPGGQPSHEQDFPSYLLDPSDVSNRTFGVFTWGYFDELEKHPKPVYASALAQKMKDDADNKRLERPDVPIILDCAEFPKLGYRQPTQCFCFPRAPNL